MSTSSQESEKGHEKPWGIDLEDAIQDYLDYLRNCVVENVDGEAYEEIAEKIDYFSDIARSLRKNYYDDISSAAEAVEDAIAREAAMLGEMLREIKTYEARIACTVRKHIVPIGTKENTEGATTSNAAESKDSSPANSAE